MGSSPPPRVYTVPAGVGFLDALASALIDGALAEPGARRPSALDIAGVTLLMPTRRAVRGLQDAFLRASGGRAALLPRVRPIAEGDEDLGLLLGPIGGGDDDLPPEVPEIERRLALTQLVLGWAEALGRAEGGGDGLPERGLRSPAEAVRLARELGRLIDMIETEGVDVQGLAGLVPEQFAEHWGLSLDFLRIVTEHWPRHLSERGLMSAAARRNHVIRREAERLARHPPAGPVIVAGVTGSIPATAELMRVAAGLPKGAVVLPALDLDLDAASWEAIRPADPAAPAHPEHPQFGLKKLLDSLGVDRSSVRLLGSSPVPASATRQRLLGESMRPARTTALWRDFVASADRDAMREALKGLDVITAATAEEEAEVVALILRRAAEEPGRTAALVTPDRLLARRVAIRLEYWGIRVDDSAGRPLAKTAPGALLDLLLEVWRTGFRPQALMALLKHPLTRLGLTPRDVRRAARHLELAIFRGPYLGDGLADVARAVSRGEQAAAAGERGLRSARRLSAEDWRRIDDLVQRLMAAFAALTQLGPRNPRKVPLADLVAAHREVALALTRDENGSHANFLAGDAGDVVSKFFSSMLAPDLPTLVLRPGDYPDLFRGLVQGEVVRPRVPVHSRLSIWGPFEARLQQADVVVLGSLNEGTWPEAADPGPWLNRTMRKALGLPSPDERIGHAAHDVLSLAGAPRVIMTRAAKSGGAPSVASRWLLRLEALSGALGLAADLKPPAEEPWIGWARARDAVPELQRIAAPAPRPALALRPRRLSVSDVERWIKNPYDIFARHILRLEPLAELGAEPDAALRGQIVHETLSRFAQRYPRELPGDVTGTFAAIAGEVLGDLASNPRIAAFWQRRLLRFAAWFAETEADRRSGTSLLASEITGQMSLAGRAGPFILTARADRIEATPHGLVITDYKTGSPPAETDVLAGFAPQLPLEAAIAEEGGFAGVPTAPAMVLRYIRATGGLPPGKQTDMSKKLPDAVARALAGLRALVNRFDDPATPYTAVRRPGLDYRHDDYAHLARAAEWTAVRGDTD